MAPTPRLLASRLPRRLAPVLALALLMAGCSAPAARSSCTIPAGSFAEVELDLAAGTKLSWDWSAGSELDFLISAGADDLEEIYAVDEVRNDTDEEPLTR